MGICRECTYFRSGSLQYGNCHRYPKTVEKYQDSSCGEYKDKSSAEEEFCKQCKFYGPVYIRQEIVGYECQATAGQGPEGCPIIAGFQLASLKDDKICSSAHLLWRCCSCDGLNSISTNHCGNCGNLISSSSTDWTFTSMEIVGKRYKIWTRD